MLAIVGVLIIIALAVYVVPSWRSAFLGWWQGEKQTPLAGDFGLYENDTFQWYRLSEGEVTAIEGSEAPAATFPGGASLIISEKGLEWRSGETELVLIEREGLTKDASALAPDGSAAVLWNDATRSFDLFTIAYEGAVVSYVGSLAAPELPTYLVAVGFANPSVLVMHTGAPESFTLYRVGTQGFTLAGAAELSGTQE